MYRDRGTRIKSTVESNEQERKGVRKRNNKGEEIKDERRHRGTRRESTVERKKRPQERRVKRENENDVGKKKNWKRKEECKK